MPGNVRSAVLVCAVGLALQGCATAPPPGRSVSRLLVSGTPEEVRRGAHELFAAMDDGWVVTQSGGAYVSGSYERGLISRKAAIRFSAAPERGKTAVQAKCDFPIDGANAAARCDALLRSLAAAVERVRADAAAAPAPPPAEAAPAQVRASSDADRLEKTFPARPNDFALVIGIEEYRKASRVPYATRDAASIEQYLSKLGVPKKNMVLLTGAGATRAAFSRYLENWLGKNASGASRVYFYYAGYGAHDPQDGTAYVLPSDADPSSLRKTAYPLARIYQMLQVLRAKEVVVLLDCGFSGEGGRSVSADARPSAVAATAVPVGPGLSLLAAAGDDEVAGALDAQFHGLFTYYALKGLQGAADADGDGHVTLDELQAYVSRNVQKEARRQEREQTPRLTATRPDLELY